MPPVQVLPARDASAPVERELGQDVDARAHVLATLRVVRGGRAEPGGRGRLALRERRVQLAERRAEAARIAAHLVQRRQAMVAVERRVLVSLGGDRPGDLLKAHDEVRALGAVGLVRPRRKSERQQIAKPVVDGDVDREAPTSREIDRPAETLAIHGVVARLAEIRAVDGEGRDDLAQRPGQAPQREVPGRAVLLRDPVQAVPEHVQLGGHRRVHDERLRLVDRLAERRAVVEQPRVDLVDRARLGAVDEDAVHQI